jgi:hypothetical protein
MSRPLLFLLSGFLFVISADPARAEKRVALVIGISRYQQVPPLGNPSHDAAAMGALFRKAGFDVVDDKRDLGIVDLRRAVREFSEKAQDADIAVVYYAGHGIEVDGLNYLVPADAKLARDFDVDDEAVSLDRVLRALDPVKHLRLVILDACRDNPLAGTIKKSVATRSIGRGLAKVEPTTPNSWSHSPPKPALSRMTAMEKTVSTRQRWSNTSPNPAWTCAWPLAGFATRC